jgi:hypothetical protein
LPIGQAGKCGSARVRFCARFDTHSTFRENAAMPHRDYCFNRKSSHRILRRPLAALIACTLGLGFAGESAAQAQVIGGANIDGGTTSALLVRSPAAAQLQAGRLVNNQFQFTALTDPGANYRIVAAVDLDNNGKAELIFQDTTQGDFGDVSVWRDFNSANRFLLRSVKRVWDVQAVGDLDGDGFGDLVWRYTVVDSPDTGVSYIWFINGSSVAQVRKRGGAPLTWTLLGAADLNGDKALDMIYVSPDNQIRVLMATPSRTCANLSAGSVPTGYTALKFGDFTGGKRGDMLVRNNATGAVQLLSLSAAGLTLPPYAGAPDDPNASCTASSLVVSSSARTLPATDPSMQFYAAGDFNGDGILDIVWLNSDGTLTLWLMQANGASPVVVAKAGTAPFASSGSSGGTGGSSSGGSGGGCVNPFPLTTGSYFDTRSTSTPSGGAASSSDSRSTVIGPGTYNGKSVIVVEQRTLKNGQVDSTQPYSRFYYDDRGTTVGVIAADVFDVSGNKVSTTTYNPVDYAPKQGTVGLTLGGSYKATTVSTVGGFSTTVTTDYSYSGSITGRETVSVTAGTFDACVFNLTNVTATVTTALGAFGNYSTTCQGSGKSWVSAPGVVKGTNTQTSCTGNAVPGTTISATNSTSELIGYQIK